MRLKLKLGIEIKQVFIESRLSLACSRRQWGSWTSCWSWWVHYVGWCETSRNDCL